MGHEISQFDIPDRLLKPSSRQASMWSDIGEAKIKHTIFGKAKIRVVREKDKILRAWVLAVLAVTALAIAAWQGWVTLKQSYMQVTPPLSERISVGPPVFHPEIVPTAKPARGKSESLIQTEIDSLVSNPYGRPPKPASLNASKPIVANAVKSQPSTESKPQPNKPLTGRLSTNSSTSTNQSNVANQTSAANQSSLANQPVTQPHPKISSPQPAAPADATPPAAQSPANKPATIALPAEPLTAKDSPPSSAGNDQTSDTENAEPQANARGTAIIFEQPDNAKP